MDYYEVLQVHPRADSEVIAKAYRALMMKYHPDHGGDSERAKRLNEAYYVLSDPAQRAAYDAYRSAAAISAAAMPPIVNEETVVVAERRGGRSDVALSWGVIVCFIGVSLIQFMFFPEAPLMSLLTALVEFTVILVLAPTMAASTAFLATILGALIVSSATGLSVPPTVMLLFACVNAVTVLLAALTRRGLTRRGWAAVASCAGAGVVYITAGTLVALISGSGFSVDWVAVAGYGCAIVIVLQIPPLRMRLEPKQSQSPT